MNPKPGPEIFLRYDGNPILSVKDWPYGVNSVFNAGVADVDGKTLLLVRVEDFRGISHFTTASSDNGVAGWRIDPKPTLMPDPESYPEELWGIEDPRITRLDDLDCWAVVYTAYSKGGPLVSLATTQDFIEFERLGSVMPPEDKDAALFPKRFGGKWAMLHRPVARAASFNANIWLSFSPDLKHWGGHKEVICARQGGWWDAGKIGLSAPPLETAQGWVVLYHGVRTTASGSIYRLGLVLLDLEDPSNVLRRTDEWVFGPRMAYEREGDVDDVVFPCGWIVRNEKIYMYYGAADSCLAMATADLGDIVKRLMTSPVRNHEHWWKD